MDCFHDVADSVQHSHVMHFPLDAMITKTCYPEDIASHRGSCIISYGVLEHRSQIRSRTLI
jgi:hypothetical protein